jgi:ABC-2 type transport system ATP-binding protein
MYSIEIKNLHKSYDDLVVLQGLNLRVVEGEVYGLLGPNGAGKSTLIHLLMGFLKPSGGRVRVLGTSKLYKVRGRVGYLPERAYYHLRYTAHEYLRFMGYFSDMEGARLQQRVEEELERFGLRDVAHRPLHTYSKGMLQRLGLAQALLSKPDLLLLDEPTSGLDPAEQRDLLDLLATVRGQGHAILLCTHYLERVEQLCDRVGVLAHGRIADETEVARLRELAGNVRILVDRLTPELCTQCIALSSALQCYHDAEPFPTIILRPNTQALQQRVVEHLIQAGVTILALEPLEHPLERFYMQALTAIGANEYTAAPQPPVVRKPRITEQQQRRVPAPQKPVAPAPDNLPFEIGDIDPEVLESMLQSADDMSYQVSEHDPLLDELLFGQATSEGRQPEQQQPDKRRQPRPDDEQHGKDQRSRG